MGKGGVDRLAALLFCAAQAYEKQKYTYMISSVPL